MKLRYQATFYLLLLCLSGCAHVDIYKDEAKQQPTGIKFYADSQAYVLVAHNKDGTVTSTIIYLKDPRSARYAYYHQGWGTANLQLAMSNGVLTSYGMQTDSKGPETITAITGLLSAAKGLAAQAGVVYADEAVKLKTAIAHLKSRLDKIPLDHSALDATRSEVDDIADRMSKTDYTSHPDIVKQDIARLKAVVKLVGTYAYPPTRVDSDTNHFNQAINAFAGEINAALDEIGGSDSSQAPVDLYRIDQSSDGSVRLVKVAVAK